MFMQKSWFFADCGQVGKGFFVLCYSFSLCYTHIYTCQFTEKCLCAYWSDCTYDGTVKVMDISCDVTSWAMSPLLWTTIVVMTRLDMTWKSKCYTVGKKPQLALLYIELEFQHQICLCNYISNPKQPSCKILCSPQERCCEKRCEIQSGGCDGRLKANNDNSGEFGPES